MPTEAIIEPSLTVFLSNYNHGRFLGEALDALLGQSVRPGRIHVVDDASTDDSRAVIESYALRYSDIIEAVFLERNRGFVANITDWLAHDDSEFILIAAADDKVGPELFERSLAVLRRFPAAGLCSACARILDEDGHDVGPFRSLRPLTTADYLSPADVGPLLMRDDGWFMGNTTIYRGAALRAVGFDRELGAFADGFACRVIALRDGACFIPQELGFWRRMTSGMASEATTMPAVVHGIAARALALMAGSYGTLFPAGYGERWRRRWLFWAVAATFHSQRDAHRDDRLQELFAPLPAIQRGVLTALAALPRRLAALSAFLWLRPFDIWPTLRRHARL